jgi:hypothetical protein
MFVLGFGRSVLQSKKLADFVTGICIAFSSLGLVFRDTSLFQTKAFRKVIKPTILSAVCLYLATQLALMPLRIVLFACDSLFGGNLTSLMPVAFGWMWQIVGCSPMFAVLLLRYVYSDALHECFFLVLDRLDPQLSSDLRQPLSFRPSRIFPATFLGQPTLVYRAVPVGM